MTVQEVGESCYMFLIHELSENTVMVKNKLYNMCLPDVRPYLEQFINGIEIKCC